MKTCKRCGEDKPKEAFHKAAQRRDGSWLRQNICKPCAKIKAREYYLDNQDRMREIGREKARKRRATDPEGTWRKERSAKLWKKYHITIEEYDALLDKQDGKCAICRTDAAGWPGNARNIFHVDHCHESLEVRGLLCNMCNQGIGHFKDNPKLLLVAVAYLSDRS